MCVCAALCVFLSGAVERSPSSVEPTADGGILTSRRCAAFQLAHRLLSWTSSSSFFFFKEPAGLSRT